MNLKEFKLLKEDDTHYHLKSEKGKTFKIEKSKLDKKAHEAIKHMCGGGQMMAEGGQMLSEEDQAKQDKQDSITGKKADNTILKSFDDRNEDDEKSQKKRAVREQLLEPDFAGNYANGGPVQNQSNPNNMNLSEMQAIPLPQQNLSTGVPAQPQGMIDNLYDRFHELPIEGTPQERSQAFLDQTKATPENIGELTQNAQPMAGGVYKVYEGTKAIPQVAEAIAPTLAERAAPYLPEIQNNFKNLMQDLKGKIPKEHLKHLIDVGDSLYDKAIENFGNNELGKIVGYTKDQISNHIGNLSEIQAFRNLTQQYKNMAKSGVLSNLTKDVAKQTKFAKGGEVQSFSEGEEVQPEIMGQAPVENFGPSMSDIFGISSAEAKDPAASINNPPIVPGYNTPNPQTVKAIMPTENSAAPQPSFDNYYKMKEAGLRQQAQATSNQAESNISYLNDLQDQLDEVPSAVDTIAKYKVKDDAFMNSLQNNKVDPNRIWHQASTSGKIMAGIGMLLSGMGSGLTGQPNLALKVIDDNINRDIEAQKSDQSNTMNLWKMNRQALGSDLAAHLATRNQLITNAQYQMMKSANQFNSEQGKANLSMALAEGEREKATNNMVQTAISPTKESLGGAQPGTEQAYINQTNSMRRVEGISPLVGHEIKRRDANFIQGSDSSPGYKTERPPTTAERNQITNQNILSSILDQSINFREQKSGRFGEWIPGEEKARGIVLNDQLKLAIAPLLLNLRRSNEHLAAQIEDSIGDLNATDFSKQQLGKLKAARDIINTYNNETLNSLRAKRFDPPQNDNVKIMNGTPHQRVPGGWQEIK